MSISVNYRQPQLNVSLSASQASINTGSQIARSVVYCSDYHELDNKPQINSVILDGNLSAHELGLGQVYYDTTYAWDLQSSLVTERGVVYIYSDYQVIYDDVGNPTYIAGIKVGDGTSYLIDMPFITDGMTATILAHITNTTVHLTDAEREFWNNKISCYLDTQDSENLILSKTDYILEGG